MGSQTKIQWCDMTMNPWEGCTKVSPGCKNCYAEARNHRFGGGNWGKGAPRRRTSAANWKLPVKWNRDAQYSFQQVEMRDGMIYRGTVEEMAMLRLPEDEIVAANPVRPRVFCASMADWLDDEVPIEWLADLFQLARKTPNLDWLMLSKRPENWAIRIESALKWIESRIEIHPDPDWLIDRDWLADWFVLRKAPHNIWIGTSVEDEKRADERIPELLKIPARIRFLSVEPMIGPIRFLPQTHFGQLVTAGLPLPTGALDWVIFGGESGPGARPCNVEWIRDGIQQCRAAGIRVFVKQLGANAEFSAGHIGLERWTTKDPKGGDMAEFPEDLRIREFPIASNKL